MHLDKGCYRGQETVARVQNLGRPPRRLVLLHLSGESDAAAGAGHVRSSGTAVRSASSAPRCSTTSSGPIALAIVKRALSPSDRLTVHGHAAMLDPADAEADLPTGFAGRVRPTQTSA